MYNSFYNLHSKPFQISSDPGFLWFGEKHKEALATLKYGILDNKGFLLLTGDVGTGKTSLINALLQSLGEDIISTSVPDPSLEKMDFFNYIAMAFGMDKEFSTKGTFLAHFRRFLLAAYENHKKVLLIIDESQLLTQEMLEEIRLLSNIEKIDAKLINIFFVGQNEFNEVLNQPQNRAVRQRLTLNYNLDPLTPEETGEYIQHRLKVAGTIETIFDTSAVQEIFMYSGGFPRRINIICDHSLLSGYVKDKKTINDLMVRECARELKIPAQVRNRDINGLTDYYSRPLPLAGTQPPLPPPRENNQKRGKIFMGAAAFALFCIFVWFLSFPDHFLNSISLSTSRFTALKNQLLPQAVPLVPDPLKKEIQSLDADPDPASADPKSVPGENQTAQEIVSVPILNNENAKSEESNPLHPVQENIPPDMINPEVNPVVRDSVQEKVFQPVAVEQIQDSGKNPADNLKSEITKEIPLLPKEKVVVRFKHDTNDFTEPGFEELKSFADILALHPQASILITGYTDSEGNKAYNQKLSEFRANIVKSFLLGKGANPDQIKIKGLGSENPVETNNTAWGRTMNRRVEIEILKPIQD